MSSVGLLVGLQRLGKAWSGPTGEKVYRMRLLILQETALKRKKYEYDSLCGIQLKTGPRDQGLLNLNLKDGTNLLVTRGKLAKLHALAERLRSCLNLPGPACP